VKEAGGIRRQQAGGGAGEIGGCACAVGGRPAVLSGARCLGSLGNS
jgi:hypothetical protein